MHRQQSAPVGSRRIPCAGRNLRVEHLEPRCLLATFTVTNFDDSGSGTLREAINLANASAGADEIRFQSSGTVRINSQLPTITDSLSIFGPNPQPSNNLMTISAGHGVDGIPGTGDGWRIFDIDNGAASNIAVVLNFIRLTGGDLRVAGQGGGAIRNRENLELSTVTLFDNAASGAGAGGGAILNLSGSVGFNNSTVRNNSTADGPGGAIHSVGGEVELDDSTITANMAKGAIGFGGGIAAEGGSVTITTSTVSHNSTWGSNSGGGGLFVNGASLLLEFSTVNANFTVGGNSHGGGLFVGGNLSNQTTISIHNSTLSENTAVAGQGGALFNDGDDISLRHATVSHNQATNGGGIASAGKTTAITRIGHTIVAENDRHDLAVADGTINSYVSLGYNLVGSGSGYGSGTANAIDPFIADATNLIDVDPKLGPLLDNGGRNATRALAFDSPAANAGKPNITGLPFPNLDQRYKTRVFGGRIDIGAYEINLTPIVVTNLNDSGPGSLRQAITTANGNGFRVEDAIVFAPDVTGVIRLNSSLPKITNPLSIFGPGADVLTIDAGGGSNPSAPDGNGYRIVEIGSSGGSPETIMFSGLTLTGADHRANGGAILNYWDFAIVDCIIVGNAGSVGGGIFHRNNILTVLNSEIRNNVATSGGGGISLFSHQGARISFSTIADNRSDTGGGVFNDAGNLAVVNSTVSGNSATYFGGGIHNSSAATLTVLASTLSGNTSSNSSSQLNNSGVASVISSTIASAGAGSSGLALENDGSRFVLHNTIVNGRVSHFGAGELLGSNNLLGQAVGSFPIVGVSNRFNLDPLLGPLADNGGPTQTHALLAGSPAIDAGDATFHPAEYGTAVFSDQRGVGFGRVVDGDGIGGPGLDIGSFEIQAASTIASDFNRDGSVNADDLTVWRNAFGKTAAADADKDGDSDGSDFLAWQRGLTIAPVTVSTASSVVSEVDDVGSIQSAPENFTAENTPALPNLIVPPYSRSSRSTESVQAADLKSRHAALSLVGAKPSVARTLIDSKDNRYSPAVELLGASASEDARSAALELVDAVFEQGCL